MNEFVAAEEIERCSVNDSLHMKAITTLSLYRFPRDKLRALFEEYSEIRDAMRLHFATVRFVDVFLFSMRNLGFLQTQITDKLVERFKDAQVSFCRNKRRNLTDTFI